METKEKQWIKMTSLIFLPEGTVDEVQCWWTGTFQGHIGVAIKYIYLDFFTEKVESTHEPYLMQLTLRKTRNISNFVNIITFSEMFDSWGQI